MGTTEGKSSSSSRSADSWHEVPEELQALSVAGIARTLLRMGEVRHGMRLALQSNDLRLCRDCGVILEGMKQYSDAAALFEKGQLPEKAAQIYILSKDLDKAAPLLAQVATPKLHLQFAQAKEALGEYEAAARAAAALATKCNQPLWRPPCPPCPSHRARPALRDPRAGCPP